MTDIRRILVIFVIAVLLAIFVQVSVDAIRPAPEYEDYCPEARVEKLPVPEQSRGECPKYEVPNGLEDSCLKDKGYVNYKYANDGCVKEAYCETCQIGFDEARKNYNFLVFLVSALAGIVAIVIGLFLPQHKNEVHEWVGSGFLLGGIISIFVGTARYFGDMGRFTKPTIILIELLLVIYLTYKKLGKKR